MVSNSITQQRCVKKSVLQTAIICAHVYLYVYAYAYLYTYTHACVQPYVGCLHTLPCGLIDVNGHIES